MHQAFNFRFLETLWQPAALRRVIDESLAANDAVGAPTTWVLSNHDVMRHASRFGYNGPVALEHGVGADDPQPARAAALRQRPRRGPGQPHQRAGPPSDRGPDAGRLDSGERSTAR
jgi:hypothetical protein